MRPRCPYPPRVRPRRAAADGPRPVRPSGSRQGPPTGRRRPGSARPHRRPAGRAPHAGARWPSASTRSPTESGRLLVVLEHARQRVETADGPRDVNPYLSPDRRRAPRYGRSTRSRSTSRPASTTTPGGSGSTAPDGARLLPSSAIWRAGEAEARCRGRRRRGRGGLGGLVDRRRRGDPRPRSSSTASTWDRRWSGASSAARRPLDAAQGPCRRPASARCSVACDPPGVLLADEYHRQDWLTAARAEGVPVAAIQHGMIYRGHNGYVHRDRPDTPGAAGPDVRLRRVGARRAGRGQRLSGRRGPGQRLAAAGPRPSAAPDADAAALRAELGVRPGDRMVVLSGTYGPAYRRFHIPYALDRLLGPAMAQCPPGREAAPRREGRVARTRRSSRVSPPPAGLRRRR